PTHRSPASTDAPYNTAAYGHGGPSSYTSFSRLNRRPVHHRHAGARHPTGRLCSAVPLHIVFRRPTKKDARGWRTSFWRFWLRQLVDQRVLTKLLQVVGAGVLVPLEGQLTAVLV